MVLFVTARATCAFAAGDAAAGGAILERAIAAGGNPGLLHYNVACGLALAGRRDAALDALDRAVEAGYRDASWIAKDEDLVSLRETPRFKALLRKLGGKS
jgi:adenylate cyclase